MYKLRIVEKGFKENIICFEVLSSIYDPSGTATVSLACCLSDFSILTTIFHDKRDPERLFL